MIKINDNYYELNLIDILLELRFQLSQKNIFLFIHIKESGDNLMTNCPFHKQGQEKKPSFGIRKIDGYGHCFTCGETSTLEQMISRCFSVNDLGQFGISWLKNTFLLENSRNIDLKLNRKNNNKIEYVKESELNKYRYYHPYMFKRKLTEDIIEKFDVGFDKESNCITFPVKDENGNCLFVARRSVVGKYFNYPEKVQKPVYGVYELKKYGNDASEIIICESIFNCLTCWVYGKYAVALNGTGTSYQYNILKKLPYRKLILGLDPDKAGRKGAIKLYQNLKNYKIITFLKGIPEGKDINDLSEDEFNKLYEKF